MATQKQLRDAIAAAASRGWHPVNGNTLAAPSTEHEISTPEYIREYWHAHSTYKVRTSLAFILAPSKGGDSHISVVFLREHPAPWVNARDSTLSFKRAIEILESE